MARSADIKDPGIAHSLHWRAALQKAESYVVVFQRWAAEYGTFMDRSPTQVPSEVRPGVRSAPQQQAERPALGGVVGPTKNKKWMPSMASWNQQVTERKFLRAVRIPPSPPFGINNLQTESLDSG